MHFSNAAIGVLLHALTALTPHSTLYNPPPCGFHLFIPFSFPKGYYDLLFPTFRPRLCLLACYSFPTRTPHVRQSVSQSVSQSASQPASQPARQSVSQSGGCLLSCDICRPRTTRKPLQMNQAAYPQEHALQVQIRDVSRLGYCALPPSKKEGT